MPEQFGDKTHEATPHRRQQAREQGQVAKSQDLASAVLLIGAVLVLMHSGTAVADFLGRLAKRQLGGESTMEANFDSAVYEFNALVLQLAVVLLPVLGLFLVVAIAVQVGQIGFLFVPQRLALDINRINPVKGIQRLFSMHSFVRLSFGIFKVLVVSLVAVWSIWGDRNAILTLGSLSIRQLVVVVFSLTFWITLKIGAALLFLAILDYAFQRWKHEQDLRMTSQEIREEMKTLQGDPQIAARRRTIQRQLVLNRLNSLVPKADIIVTNPTELAVAIQFDHQTMVAPIVVAKGAGVLAQRIRRLALEASILIVERKELAQALYKQIEPGHPVPTSEYAAVAEVLRYVYQLQGKALPNMRQAA